MALNFAKKGAAPTTTKPAQPAKGVPAGGAQVPSFLMRGAQAKQAIVEEENRVEAAKAQSGKMWSFRMAPNEERKITFLDGDLDSDGALDCYLYHQHTVKIAGKFQNYICTREAEGHCPICDAGESKPTLVGVLTVIDHTPYTITSGQNQGQVVKNRRRLFVFKPQTYKILVKKASKHQGLAGVTFEVTRGDEKSPSVGNQFDFVEKLDGDQLVSKYDLQEEDIQPADYGEELVYRSADELVALGLGKPLSGPGYEKGVVDKAKLASQL